jgi:hypothetical protein
MAQKEIYAVLVTLPGDTLLLPNAAVVDINLLNSSPEHQSLINAVNRSIQGMKIESEKCSPALQATEAQRLSKFERKVKAELFALLRLVKHQTVYSHHCYH